ncbi:hypothetical protein BLNAU_5322 [Blattamonas nauphoetae]|uniref:Uncharacterized protein n=1 Tax=Blattamonas nauphoetae TaxID=2049346 RepID=A0ABQ9Y7T8_9EUKA|nr:hypothetical protein BLNAU_5322 [Blattamonas nauphoetae]
MTFYDQTQVRISNSSFVDCEALVHATVLIDNDVALIALDSLLFRNCQANGVPESRDIYIDTLQYTVVRSKTSNCDSTSGSPNIYFASTGTSDSSIIPQITSTPTVETCQVTFSGNVATVTVTTKEVIGGTMWILLEGCLVPRLVFVVFDRSGQNSSIATETVTSGANGILPSATYKHRSYTLRGDISIQVISASAVLIDVNTARITLKGVSLQTGTYSMQIKNGADTFNISLTRSDSTTLTGNAPMVNPLTGSGKLHYSTQYEVTLVHQYYLGVVNTIQRALTLNFTTPETPPRISSADCSLGGDQQKSALVVLTGVKLGGGKNFKLTVRKMEGSTPTGGDIVLSGTLSGDSSSTTHTHTVVIFGISNPLLSFGTTYLITKFEVTGSVSVVDDDTTFSIPPEPPRIVGIEAWQLNQYKTKLIVELSGNALLSRPGQVILTDGITIWESLSDVSVLNTTHCKAEFAVGFDETTDQLKYGGVYTLKESWTESSGFYVEDGLTDTIPLPPIVTDMEFSFSNTLRTGCFVTLTGRDLPVGESLKVTLSHSHSFIATVTSDTNAMSNELQIGRPTTLLHNTLYKITSIVKTSNADEKTLFDLAVSDTTGPPIDNFVIFVDSSMSSGPPLSCGERLSPCASIED